MEPIKILNNKKSTYGSPYCYYTVEVTNIDNRTATSVDITFKITSHLAYSSSSFGTGGNRSLNAQLYINGVWSSKLLLKATTDSWSGTSPHSKTYTLTINNLASTDTTLSDIKFKVISGASDNACQLNATACSDITIPIGHTPPSLTAYTMTEASSSSVYNVVANNVIAENLSIKQFVVTYELFDDATINRVGIYNEVYPYSTTTYTISGNQVTYNIDFSQISLFKDETDNKIPIATRMIDSFDTMGTYPSPYTPDKYTYIPYTPPTIIESNVVTKRAGQLTGEATLSLDGTYYKSTDALNQSNNIVVRYKYWENKENPDIPVSYTTIPSASVTINNDGTFSVSGYTMGNDFDPEKSYRVLVKVSDAYKSYELTEPKSIAVGEALWTEYKDRVDFKKLTIKGNEILYKNIITANAKTSQTLSTTSWTKVPVELTNSVGDKLEISNDGIKVLNDGYVYVSANILFSSGTTATRRGVSIYKNDTQITYCNIKGDTTYTGASITPLLIPVSANDVIYLYAINQGASGSVLSANDTYLNVEVVQ